MPYIEERTATRIAAREKKKRAAKREPLREKEDSQKKAVHGEENRKETVNCYHL